MDQVADIEELPACTQSSFHINQKGVLPIDVQEPLLNILIDELLKNQIVFMHRMINPIIIFGPLLLLILFYLIHQ